MNIIPRAEYPRPEFERGNWLSLNGIWDFSINSDSFDRKINVPFACETELSGIRDRSFHSRVYYQREVQLPESMKDKRLLLHFGAVDYYCFVWIDNKHVCHHEGGQTPFCVDITDWVQGKNQFSLRVDVQDDPSDIEMPRGKQFWEETPRSIFYDRTTGIWQSVWIEAVSNLYLDHCHITPDVDKRSVKFEYVLSKKASYHLAILICCRGKNMGQVDIISEGMTGSIEWVIDQGFLGEWNFQEDLCWSPEHPQLFDVTYLLYEKEQLCDEVKSYFGFRKVSVRDNMFMLNNRPYFQKLVLNQGYWPDSLLTAPTDEDYIRDIMLIKEMGFNGVRMHQKVEDPRFLYHADRIGLIVWGEIGSAYTFSERSSMRLLDEWKTTVLRDYNHPCIVVWVPLNESWGVEQIAVDGRQKAFSQTMFYLTKSLDSTRLVVSNDGWEHTDGELLTIHDYTFDSDILTQRYSTKEMILKFNPSGRAMYAEGYKYRGEPILVSELGGIKFDQDNEARQSWGYCDAKGESEFLHILKTIISSITHSGLVIGYCYTQLTDVGTEKNGLLTEQRIPKVSPEKIKEIMD